ncbi:FadR/GntR family transcriptional regulator [Microbacterium sp. 18062]|uniref:FadR/GntR family transcriptional regulator n=1 Tax=Microbacterium sp. 18062 TaxID=2681410 RepID=UPI00135ACD39|nr:FCD domain-containing protein [Microbacterium sp. 18062]
MNQTSGSARARTTLAFLRRNIASGEWPINSRIPTEPELMTMLEVGKTTVREAVRSLASLGMLETLPGRGTFVRSRTPVSSVLTEYLGDYDTADLLVYRRALEVEAAHRAALNRTEPQLDALREVLERSASARRDVDYPPVPERGRTPGQFHFLIMEASGSRLLPGVYAGVMAVLRHALDRGEVAYGADEDVRQTDHDRIVAAIAEQDPSAAARAMAAHVDRDLIARVDIDRVVPA